MSELIGVKNVGHKLALFYSEFHKFWYAISKETLCSFCFLSLVEWMSESTKLRVELQKQFWSPTPIFPCFWRLRTLQSRARQWTVWLRRTGIYPVLRTETRCERRSSFFWGGGERVCSGQRWKFTHAPQQRYRAHCVVYFDQLSLRP